MRYLRWGGLLSSLLIVGVLGGLMAPLPSEALTVTINGSPVSTTTRSCDAGYNLCRSITPGVYAGGTWTVGNVSGTNTARVMIGDNSAAGSLDLMKLTGITFTPVVLAGTKTATVVISHTYNAGGGNPQGNYSWGFGMAGHFDPPATENIVPNRLQLTGTGTFPSYTPASISLGGLDTGVLATPATLNLNGSITRSKAAVVVKPNCNTGSARCAPTITQTFTITVTGQDTLKLTDSVISAGGTCRLVDQVIPIPPYLYALMLKLDPNAPNDINQLSAWLGRMGEKYLKNPKAKAALASLISALEKWLAKTVPGTCPEVEEAINELIEADFAVEVANCEATAEGCAPAETAPETGTITITKNTGQESSDTFTFKITGPSPSTEFITQPIDMGGANSTSIDVTLDAGTYSVEEINNPEGWSLTSSSCGVEGPTTGVVVEAGGNVSCTFNNSPVGTGKIQFFKKIDPGAGVGTQPTFNFNGTGAGIADFSLTIPALPDPQQAVKTFSGLITGAAGGSRDITETSLPNNWELRSAGCGVRLDPPNNQWDPLFSGTTLIGVRVNPLADDATLSCTFINVWIGP